MFRLVCTSSRARTVAAVAYPGLRGPTRVRAHTYSGIVSPFAKNTDNEAGLTVTPRVHVRSLCTAPATGIVGGLRGALRDKKADTRTYVYGVTTEMMASVPEAVRKMLDIRNASKKDQTKVAMHKNAEALKISPNDVGSAGVVVARLTTRITAITEHVESIGRKDQKAKRRITLLLAQRRKILKYLRSTDVAMYVKVLDTLDLSPIKLFPQKNKLAPISRRDEHPDQRKKMRKFRKGRYQHLYDVPTSHNIKTRVGEVVGFKDTPAQKHLSKQKKLAKGF